VAVGLGMSDVRADCIGGNGVYDKHSMECGGYPYLESEYTGWMDWHVSNFLLLSISAFGGRAKSPLCTV
jgi:hypothetical protein